jgi:low temperature requirement protein LtrA
MAGRDPSERHRVATSLELLFDLTFVIAFAEAASGFSRLVTEGHIVPALLGFGFCTFGICWPWVNFTWFASAYDTDDWVFRVTTMIQMVGVLVLATGVPGMFELFDGGGRIGNPTVVLGYVIMRVPMIFQWLRAAKQDPTRRETCLVYAKSIALAQVGWVLVLFFNPPVVLGIVMTLAMTAVELLGPWLAERRGATPWHPHHIAERYGLMAIITLGEVLVGTTASLTAEVSRNGWSFGAVAVGLSGMVLTFGMWWTYGMLPSGQVLHHQRHKAFRWGLFHIVLFGTIAATGAGLRVAASFIAGDAEISALGAVLAVVVPFFLFGVVLSGLYAWLMGPDSLHTVLFAVTSLVYLVVVGLAWTGVAVPYCLMVLAIVPVIAIVTDERVGARHRVEALQALSRRG